MREASRDESQNVLSTQKLFKTRDLELPNFWGSLPICSLHSAGYTRTSVHTYFPVANTILLRSASINHPIRTPTLTPQNLVNRFSVHIAELTRERGKKGGRQSFDLRAELKVTHLRFERGRSSYRGGGSQTPNRPQLKNRVPGKPPQASTVRRKNIN